MNQWFRDAGSAAELISITRFLPGSNIFRAREGGYGMSFRLRGIDPECLDDNALTAASAQVLQAMRLIPEDFVLYQMVLRRRGYVPPASQYLHSPNQAVAETQAARGNLLATSGLATVELYWTLYARPLPAARRLTPEAHAAATDEQIRRLVRVAEMLEVNLQEIGLRRIPAAETCELYGYLATLRGHRPGVSSFDYVAQQLAGESVKWTDHGLKIGRRHAKLFSLLLRPKSTRPNLFGELARIDADLVLAFEVQRRSTEQTGKAVQGQQTFKDLFRERLLTVLAHIGPNGQAKAMPKSATGVAADTAIDTLGGVVDDLENQGLAYCHFSLIGLLHSEDAAELDLQMAHVHRIVGQSQASVLEEGLGALSAHHSLFPGASLAGHPTNVRRWWLREDHAANLSMLYAPYRGEPYSNTLEREALARFETRDLTDFAYDPYANGLRGVMVLGEARRGKSFLLNYLMDMEAKYEGYIFIFDVGGSYEQVALKHGGSIVRFGLDGPRLNPFALEDTERNRQFVCRLVKMLLTKGGARVEPKQEVEINARVDLMFSAPGFPRRLKHLILPATLQPYLAKWCEGGVYGNIFDNVEDELELTRIVAFDFEALGAGQEQQDLMEPLLSWVRWRIAEYTHDRSRLGVPKVELYDECWRHLRDEQMAEMIVATSKTAAKHLGGIILATQSPEDLGQYATLIRNNCPDAFFLGGSFDRQQYIDLFGLHEGQLDLIAGLQKGESLLVRKNYSKVLKLRVDERSKWLYSSDPNDRRRRDKAIKDYGREGAFQHLVATATAK